MKTLDYNKELTKTDSSRKAPLNSFPYGNIANISNAKLTCLEKVGKVEPSFFAPSRLVSETFVARNRI